MTAFCFMHRDKTSDGYSEPSFPEEVDFLLLAGGPSASWAVYEYDDGADAQWSPDAAISSELAAVIESAKRYPPALALARDELTRLFSDHDPTRSEFADAYAEALRLQLGRQHAVCFVLARAVRNEPGYLVAGQWYWVLSADGDLMAVRWVSADYHVYNDPASNFEFSSVQLTTLRSRATSE